jgi:ATP-dependent DNA helicase RecG
LGVKKLDTGRWFEEELGRADELGSGVRNIFEYYKYYSDQKPRLEEKDVFNCFVFTDKNSDVTDKVADKVTDNQRLIIEYILENNKISASEMAEKIGISKRKVLENIKKLKDTGILQRAGSPKAGLWLINE